jgi:Alpha-L-fucosidase
MQRELKNFRYEIKASERIYQKPALEPNAFQREQMERQFGMFIHFGVNTFGNVEWSNGGIDALSYQPTVIDAEQWVRTAWEAGMNYVVLITKHHDGFCLWDTEYTNYSIKHSGNTTDVVKAVSEACAKYGIKLGLYYSLWDCKEGSYQKDFANGYIPYMLNQLTELLDGRYGQIVELWLDGSWDKSVVDWRFDLIYDTVKRLQPRCQIGINHTVGEYVNAAGFPDECWQPQYYQLNDPLRMFTSDFRLWDPYCCRADDPKIYTFEGENYYLPFEMTICSREGFSWFYSNIYEDKPYIPVDKVVADYKIAIEASNMVVINMPPNIEGKLVQGDIDHLMAVSRQLGINRK